MQTPIDIWQNSEISTTGFNPSILAEKIIGDHTVRELYITTLKNGADSYIRTFVRIVFPTGIKKAQIALYIPSTSRKPTDAELIALADGYAVATFDYLGEGFGHGNSIYVGEYEHFSYAKAKENINFVPTVASETCWACWTKTARCVISYLLNSAFFASNSKVVLLGEEEGAVIMWHTSAFDTRVSAGVSILGYGYPPFKMLDIADGEKFILTEDNEKWIAGISSQSVAQHIKIPILSLISSNNSKVNMERLADVIGFLKDETFGNLSISARTSGEILESSYNAMTYFIKSNLKSGTKSFPIRPTLSDEMLDGTLKITIKVDKNPTKVYIMVASAKTNAEFRNWQRLEATCINKDECLYTAEINSRDYSCQVYYYCSAYYKDMQISSLVYDEKFPHIDFKKGSNRLLYESRIGEDSFTSENSGGLYVAQNNVHLDAGACGINGITVTTGALVWYKPCELKYAATEDLILQLDVAAKKEAEIVFKILKKVDDKYVWFMSKVAVKPSEKWTKLSIPHQEFKTEEFLVMKNWENMLKFKIEGVAEGDVLFNNFLFI